MDIQTIIVNGIEIRIKNVNNETYLCLTDIAKGFNNEKLIEKWLTNKSTIEFLGIWEELNNDNFNSPEFVVIKNEAGSNRFLMSVKKWVNKTNAIGLVSKAGKYDGGTYAQKDIALHFCSWVNPAFQLYVIKEFQRLKKQEAEYNNIDWNIQRLFTKENYKMQTDAIKNDIISNINVDKSLEWLIYADEADLLNKVVFGKTARQWRDENPEKAKSHNIRDYATAEELLVLTNCESANTHLIKSGLNKEERFNILKQQAEHELTFFKKSQNKILKDNLIIDKILEK